MSNKRKSQRLQKNLKSVSNDAWFGPSQPINPVAQVNAFGRQFAFQVGSNLNYTPRATEPIKAADLRLLSENLDILRAVIETRKDQICVLDFDIIKKDGSKGDARCDALKEFFTYPDKENDWATWLRILIDDLLVIDAPTLYVNKTIGGEVYALEIIDGASVKVLIDEKGRSPVPPDASYQTVFYGVPAVDYTKEELIYRPRNKRSYKLYGFSPVEQILMTVNIALKRQLSQLQYYTEGNIPSAIMSTPETWTLENIKLFQEYWDSILEGNTAKRRHAIFTPHGVTINPTKENPITDQFDEWLARIVCYVFSVSPQAFAKQSNRATAEVNKQTADEEGIIPLKIYVKSLIDYIINNHFGYKDIEFSFVTEQNVDPEIQAKIDDLNIRNMTATINEVRESRGLDPLSDEELLPPPTQVTVSEDATADETQPQEDVKKYAKTLDVNDYLDEIRDEVIEYIKDNYDDATSADDLLNELMIAGFADLVNNIQTTIRVQYINTMNKEVIHTGDETITKEMIKKEAIKYAQEKAADLITKLEDSTKNMIKADIVNAIENDLTAEDLAKELQTNYAFSEQRAKTIATYELAQADTAAKLIFGSISDNVIGKRYLKVRTSKSKQCDECDKAAAMGTVSLDDNFNGIGDAPAHPNCTHIIELVTKENE